MKHTLKRYLAIMLVACMLALPFKGAEGAVLATVQADVDGDGCLENIELQGEKTIPGSNYYGKLLLVVRNGAGKMLTAWHPDLEGGYYCLLEKIPLAVTQADKKPVEEYKEKTPEKSVKHMLPTADELVAIWKEAGREVEAENAAPQSYDRILLTVGKGGERGDMLCRILDFSRPANVKEEFSGADNLGIRASAAYLPGRRFSVEYVLSRDGSEKTTHVEFNVPEPDTFRIFTREGALAKTHLRPEITEIVSLAWQNNCLFTVQNVLAADHRNVLARLTVRWAKGNGNWQPVEVKATAAKDGLFETGTIDRPAKAGDWQLYSRRAWIGERSISRPVVAVEEKPELQNKINGQLEDWYKAHPAEEERAFQVKFAGPKLLCLELGRRNLKGDVIRDMYNFDMQTGDLLPIDAVFAVKNPDFLKVINLVGEPRGVFTEVKPQYWHREGDKIVFQDRLLSEAFQEEENIKMSVVALSDLRKLIRRQDILSSK